MRPPALVIDDLTVTYSGRTVVDHLSLTASAGAITAVLGPNGAGKTTTIECAEGLRQPDSGSITVLGHKPGSSAARAGVGVMLQDGGLPMSRSVREVLSLLAAMHGRSSDVNDLLEQLDLTEVTSTAVRRLSGGQRQRVSLGGAILAQPELLFLDEPSAGLDPLSRRLVWDLVRSLRDGGTGVVLTTHLLEEAESLADTVHVMVSGALAASGTPHDLIAKYASSDTVRLRLSQPLAPGEAQALATHVGARLITRAGDAADVVTLSDEATPALVAGVANWCLAGGHRLLSLDVGGGTLEHAYLHLTAPTASAATASASDRMTGVVR